MRHLNTPALALEGLRLRRTLGQRRVQLGRVQAGLAGLGNEGRAIDANGFVAEYSSEGHPIHHPPPDPCASR